MQGITHEDIKNAHALQVVELFIDYCYQELDRIDFNEDKNGDPLPIDPLAAMRNISECSHIAKLATSSFAEHIIMITSKAVRRGRVMHGEKRIISNLLSLYDKYGIYGLEYAIGATIGYKNDRGRIAKGASCSVTIEQKGVIRIEGTDRQLLAAINISLPKKNDYPANSRHIADEIYTQLNSQTTNSKTAIITFEKPLEYLNLKGVTNDYAHLVSPFAFCCDSQEYNPNTIQTSEYRHVVSLVKALSPTKRKKLIELLEIPEVLDWPYQEFAGTDREDFYESYAKVTGSL